MFGQVFQTSDLASIAALVVLEGLLSADNALVLAIMVRHLPKKLRQRALLYGIGGSFALRLLAIVFATTVLKLWWLQGVGAVYLLAMPIKHFATHKSRNDAKPVGAGFWQTVVAVELTDVAFAVDSVLAGVSFVDNRQDKIWVVYSGAMVGILMLRFAAGAFMKLLDKFPIFDHLAYVLVGWVGVKLMALSAHSLDRVHPDWIAGHVPEMPPAVFWTVLAIIVFGGSILAITRGKPQEQCEDDAEAEDFQKACALRLPEDEVEP